MKHLLCGTTALVAAGLIGGLAAPAKADDKPIQITIGGYFYAFFDLTQSRPGTVDTAQSVTQNPLAPSGSPATAESNRGIKDKSRIQFDGRTQLDNGLVAGLRVQLRGNTADSSVINSTGTVGSSSEDQIDEHFLFLDSASYGRMEAGATASAPRKMWYGAVTPAMPYHGLNSPTFIEMPGANAGVVLAQPTTLLHSSGQTDRADKVSYFTPRIGGFQLGVSYAPNECNSNDVSSSTGGPAGAVNLQCHFLGANPLNDVPGQFANIWAGGLNYTSKFGDFTVGTYAGFEHSTNETDTTVGATAVRERDRNEYGAGLSLGAYGFTAGVSWRFDDQGTKGGTTAGHFGQTNRNDANAGLSYGQGPWSIGGSVAYAEADERDLNGANPTIKNTATAKFAAQDKGLYEALGANYVLGPGINLNAAIEHMDVAAATNSLTAANKAWLYTVGTALNF